MNVSMVKAAFSALLLIFLCIFGALTMVIGKALHLRLVESFPLFFHGLACRLFSLTCEIEGLPSAAQPTLYVANHVSYLDVLHTTLGISSMAYKGFISYYIDILVSYSYI